MSSQAEKTQTDKVNNGALATLSLVGTAALVAIYLGVTALVRHQADIVAEHRYDGADYDVKELRKGWEEKLNAPPKRDPKRGTIALPIDVAMGAVVSDLQRDPRTATAYMPADAGVADAAVAADAAAAADEADAAPAPTEGAGEGQPQPEGAPVEEKKPEEPKKKPKPGGATLGGAVAPRQPLAPEAPAKAPAPAPAEETPY